jgi:cyclic-di-GMP phosphodiesterase TipF (flagellum assembly factor)
MRRLTLGLLCATYVCLSLIVAFWLWRNGGGWGAGVAAMVGGLGLCFAFHGLIERALETAGLRGEIADIREAHAILIDQVEALDERLGELAVSLEGDEQRAEALSGEVHLLEDLVARLQARLDEHGEAQPLTLTDGVPGLARPQPPPLLEVVRAALAENRVDLYLQPIVALPQRKTLYYESFSRLRDATGRVMMPAEYLAVAEPGGLVTAIDNLLLFRCVQIVRRLARQDRKIGIFCNISMASLADESFFPQFLELLAANRDLAGSLIFELGQPAFDARGSIEARNMGKLADLGFRFSVDKVADLDLDLQDLSRSDVKFVKVAAQLLLDQLEERDGRLVIAAVPDLAAEDYAGLTRRYGVELIVEKVETERQVAEVLDLGVGFGQGHLFGEPRAIKDQVLAEAGPPPPMIRESLARAAFG